MGTEKDADMIALANKLAEKHLAAGQYNEAEEYLRLRLDACRQARGPLDVDTLALSRHLIEVQILQGKYRVALMAIRGSMKNHASVYGEHHQLTLDSRMLYGGCQLKHGKLDEAATLYRGILKSLKYNEERDRNGVGLGPKYKYKVYVAYAECLIAQELYREAEEIHLTLMDLSKQVNGDNDPQTLCALKTLAWIKTRLKKLTEAEALYREALGLFSQVFGERHVETLEVALPYADLLYSVNQGIPGPALRAVNDLYHRILELQIETSGGNEVLDGCFESMSRIADIEETLGDLEGAEGTLRRAQRVAEELFGAKRLQTISIIFNLASIIMRQEKLTTRRKRSKERSADALSLYRRVLKAWKVTPSFGPVHPDTLKIVVIMAELQFDLDLREDAMEILERALVACERSHTLGKDASETIQMAFEAAKMYRKTGDCEAALVQLVRVLDWRSLRSKALLRMGGENVDAMRVTAEHGLLFVEMGRFAEAQGILDGVLPEFEREFGPADVETLAVVRGCVGTLLGEFGESGEAGLLEKGLALAQSCSATTEGAYGKSSLEAMESATVLADALVAAGRRDQAEALLTNMDTLCSQEMGADDPEMSLRLCWFHAKTQNHFMAQQYSMRALNAFSSAYGETHTKTLSTKTLHTDICTLAAQALEAAKLSYKLKAEADQV